MLKGHYHENITFKSLAVIPTVKEVVKYSDCGSWKGEIPHC